MMKVYITLFVCVTMYVAADGQLAPFITPCRARDSACLKSSAQKALPVLAAGIPSLGVESMDPMSMNSIVANQAGLAMDFRNTVVRGLRNCVVENLQRKGLQTHLDLNCTVTMIGDYKLGGSLLVLPIEGKGKYKIVIQDILVKIFFDLGEKTSNGEKYWILKNARHSYVARKNVKFYFQNLYNGDKMRSDTVHEFANSNWREIFQEVAPPIVKAIVDKIVEQCFILFDKVPISQLALD